MTTTPELSREQRDAAMVERYSDGETLDAIGQSFGVTRERVRQIIAKVGGTNAEESRRKRTAAREAAVQDAYMAFLTDYEGLAKQMARRGCTRTDAMLRLEALYPGIDMELAEDALKSSDIVFDHNQVDDIFSKEAVAAGIWYLLGSELGLAPDPEWAAVHLELSLMAELRDALEAAQVTPEDVATILGVIGAAQKHIEKNPSASITAKRYHRLRDELIPALGLVSRKGLNAWPPTGQTLMKRFGSWNEALEAMGIGTTKRGRSKGLLKFTREDYDNAVRDYCSAALAAQTKATNSGYDMWARAERADGRERPSIASVRGIYGSWSDAVRSVQE